METARLLDSLENLFELDPGEITAETAIADIPGWDSLSFLALIATVDEDFGVTLSPTQVLTSPNLEVLASLIDVNDETGQAAA